jgi:class 3 adenylate cyclase
MEGTETGTRKLAAIMFTDMVGFSALTQSDEAKALKLLAEHNEIFRAVLGKHEGREVKSTGDGFLLEFPSALNAVQCAIEVQQTLHDRNLIEEDKIGVRIGIHLGDVVSRDGDIFGDGVNIASRIEPLAETGGICVSGAVSQQVENKITNQILPLGESDLKNIATEIAVHRIVMPWEGQAAPKTKRKVPVQLLLVAAIVILGGGGWAIYSGMNLDKSPQAVAPLSESQELVEKAKQLIANPMAYRETWFTAKELTENAIELDSLNGEAYAVCAQASFYIFEHYKVASPKEIDAASRMADKSFQLDPDSVETLLARFFALSQQRDDSGRQFLVENADRFPADVRIPRYVVNRALFLPEEQANSEYTVWKARADAIDGEDHYCLAAYAVNRWIHSDYDLALELIERSLEIQESTDAYHWKLMTLVSGIGDLEKGRELIEDLPLQLHSEDRIAFLLFRTWYRSGMYSEAVDSLQSWNRPFIEQDLVFYPVGYLRGLAHDAAGSPAAAAAAFEFGLTAVRERQENDPTSIELIGLDALILAKLGQMDEAEEKAQVYRETRGESNLRLELALGNYDWVISYLEERIGGRQSRGLNRYQQALTEPEFQVLRDDPRFEKIMQAGEEWLNETLSQGNAEQAD